MTRDNGTLGPVGSAAMKPHGLALLAYVEGNAGAQLIVRRNDGLEAPLPVSLFFRMLGHGIGIAGALPGLDRLLRHVRGLTRPGGHLLVHSLDVRRTTDPLHLRYHDANRRAGRYAGSSRTQFVYGDHTGPYCNWLHVDRDTLAQRAAPVGWSCDVLVEEASGEYLARLTRIEG